MMRDWLKSSLFGPVATPTIVVSANGATFGPGDYSCDGTADEVQINAAIQQLPTIGGRIQLTEGQFNLSSPILTYRDVASPGCSVAIVGCGMNATRIKLASGANCNGISHLPNGTNNSGWLTIQELTLDGNIANNTAGNGIYMYASGGRALFDTRINNVMCISWKGRGIYSESSSWCLAIINSITEFCGNDGTFIQGGQNYINGLYASYNDSEGLFLNHCTGCLIENVYLLDNGVDAVYMDQCDRCNLANIFMKDYGTHTSGKSGIVVDKDSAGNMFSNINIQGFSGGVSGTTIANPSYGIQLLGSRNVFTGVRVRNINFNPIIISNQAAANIQSITVLTKTIVVTGNLSSYLHGQKVLLAGTAAADGTYSIHSATYSTPNTTIVVHETIAGADAGVLGTLTPTAADNVIQGIVAQNGANADETISDAGTTNVVTSPVYHHD